MNKVFLGLILAVCVLGMALVMLNDRLGRKPEPRPAPVAESFRQPARTPEEIAAKAKAMELAEAALAPPAARERKEHEEIFPGQEPLKPEAPKIPAVSEPAPMPAPKPASEPKLASLPKPEPAQRTEPAPRPEQDQKPEPKPAQQPAKAEQAKTEQPKTASAGADGKTATKFVIYAREKGATVRVGGNAKVEYSSMTLENPNRVVVDLAGDWKFPPNPGIPRNELVSAVRVGQNGDKTRLVIDLKIKPRKVILVPFKNGDGVDVRVDK